MLKAIRLLYTKIDLRFLIPWIKLREDTIFKELIFYNFLRMIYSKTNKQINVIFLKIKCKQSQQKYTKAKNIGFWSNGGCGETE